MRADIGDLSKSNQAIFEVTESPKSSTHTYNFEEYAKNTGRFPAFIQKSDSMNLQEYIRSQPLFHISSTLAYK